jgi:hypothetical protein
MSRRRLTRAQLTAQASLEWLQEREDAQTVPCPGCLAPSQVTCRNPITGEPLQRFPAHPARITLRARTSRTAGSSRSTVAATSALRSPTRSRAA